MKLGKRFIAPALILMSMTMVSGNDNPVDVEVDSVAGDPARAAWSLDYSAEFLAAGGSNRFAPYYVMSNRHGLLTQAGDILLSARAIHPMEKNRRFSFGYGVQAVAGWGSGVDYTAFDSETKSLYQHTEHPAAVFLQQLYGEVKYRSVFLMVGLKDHQSPLLNFDLSSGDLIESGNARNIPQVRVGFIDFVDIPFTNGWVQIQGEIAYGKYADNGWLKHHYNYYDDHVNLGGLYTYKRCFFRTKPSQPFSVTVGMQTAGSFGGTTSFYRGGNKRKETKNPASLKTFWKMFLPLRGEGSAYYEGSSLGSWDINFRYRLGNGDDIKAYIQKPWEDGSGIGWMNGFDGLWGLEYKSATKGAIVDGAVLEYLDFTNQSGGIHWSPADSPGTNLISHATGGDQYYNNYSANAYAYYGMGLGTPFLPAPIYNTDGYLAYVHNRVRGFHAAVTGSIAPQWRYRLMGSYRKGWGDSRISTPTSPTATSLMIEVRYNPASLPALDLKAQLATDLGSMLGDRWGLCLSAKYSGRIF